MRDLCKEKKLPKNKFNRLIELSLKADRVDEGGDTAWLQALLLNITAQNSDQTQQLLLAEVDDVCLLLRQLVHTSPIHCWIPPRLTYSIRMLLTSAVMQLNASSGAGSDAPNRLPTTQASIAENVLTEDV